MSIRVALTHATRYAYAAPASLSAQLVRLRPAPHNRTPVHSYSLRVAPAKHFLNWIRDPHGNFVARIVLPERAPAFEVTVDLVVDLEAFNPFDFFLEPYAEKYPFEYPPELRAELEPYLATSELGPKLAGFVERCDRRSRRVVDFLVDVNRRVASDVRYVIRHEPGVQTPDETLERGEGSCRDSGWLLVHALRRLGVAARFVSGYLIQLKPDQPATNGAPGPAQDFCDLHAWCECFIPGAGWIGLDPTSGLFAAEGHIPLACAAHPAAAAPIEGRAEKVDTAFEFTMSVTRLDERPRVTLPYSSSSWQRILELGVAVDRELEAQDARLTMGGEPTFVSSEEPAAPEWNVAALGGKKLALADRLLRRLHQRWQPGGMLFHGQGKWYPGEELPRWAIGCLFRSDGVPLWNDATLFAASGESQGHTAADAERFVLRLAEKLGLERFAVIPAYEDVWYYLWRERRLPGNVDPLDSRLEDPAERERLGRIFREGLGNVVGWVLPLAHAGHWQSGCWFLREEHCFLLPGDSPMGFRLPLDSLPWVVEGEREPVLERDPFAERAALPRTFDFPPRRQPSLAPVLRPQHPEHADTSRASGSGAFERPAPFESATGRVRTALCVEPRAGTLRVFMPPLETLEAYVELVAALEQTSAELGLPVQIEGYEPPRDPRLQSFRLTPDPGVLEVNVPPVASFGELVEQTETLYECARQETLVPEKFEIDGTHVPAGGGHHLVLGAAAAENSPFLRRPDLLASLIAYFHNHPSLSYLFSGRFIGPTSQAPRIDEARNDAVHEIELAFAQLPRAGRACPPWLVDRVLRNLLVDVTGNTHRAEFCIDKLYSPDGPAGRLGLLELRGFEMAPHARMAVASQLLLRALVASFLRQPYRVPLEKWGTALHDRFMLPHFVWQDFREVLRDLGERGHGFMPEWFEPHFEFRFPRCGDFVKDGVQVEVRVALEPWPVLGEEAAAGGQARYVDSSLERVQVRAQGLTEGRHRVCCNGIELPLWPTGTVGERVCGVRYRAWQPPSCLHPTIGVHSPLHFDLYDGWNARTIAGGTYHVVHPGGLAPDDRPVNAVAAEGRRLSRFDCLSHTPGAFSPRRAPENPGFPLTLDLRLS
jgi:uncharacterized protein (DUF2126 family)/transglutaminase-like putative cysteine protease